MPAVTERSALIRLSPMRAELARRVLAPPWVPAMLAPAIAQACRARALGVPVCLDLPTPSLAPRLARALHALTGGAGPLFAAVDGVPELRGLPLGASVVLDVVALDVEAQLQLEALLDDGEAWVLAVGAPDAAPAALGVRLRSCVVSMPSLARRTLELPALSAAILHTLAQRAGRPTPTLTPRARTLLATCEWPGDVLELEARLAGALAASETTTLDEADLGLAPPPGDTEPEVADTVSPPVSSPARPADLRLEILLAELAHEVLNPLVTVKTFAGHLPQLLDDDDLRQQFAARADEAVERIQQLLDNVIAFARFGVPCPVSVEVGPVLDRLLADVAPELAARAVEVRRVGTADVTCTGDAAQLEYALRNLMAGVIREAPPRDAFTVETSRNGIVRVQFSPGKAAAARLRRLVSPDGDDSLTDPSLLPLSFSLARAVLERNGGRLDVDADPTGATTLVVRLPTAPDEDGG